MCGVIGHREMSSTLEQIGVHSVWAGKEISLTNSRSQSVASHVICQNTNSSKESALSAGDACGLDNDIYVPTHSHPKASHLTMLQYLTF